MTTLAGHFGGALGRARAWSTLAVSLASLLAALLVPSVLESVAGGDDAGTLARALPAGLGGVLLWIAQAPLLAALLVALLPFAMRVAAGLAAGLVRSDERTLERGQALAWCMSAAASAATLATGPHDLKQGMAALGYALGWPAVISLAAVLWSCSLPRVASHGLLLATILGGLVVRALPLGWPGEQSLSWWAMLPRAPLAVLLGSLCLTALAATLAIVVPARGSRWPAAVSLSLLALASLLLLRALPGFEHYGPDKHPAALASEINTSYLQASTGALDPAAFVRRHADAMVELPMHARTHPPTWPLAFRAAVGLGERPVAERVALATATLLGADMREAAGLAASVAERPLTSGETTGLWLLVALLAVAVAALPAGVWFVMRAFAGPQLALRAAALAVLLPAPLLYFPDVDVLHPLLYALATGAWLRRERSAAWPLLAGTLTALLVALSFGNLALLALFASVVWFASDPSRTSGPRAASRELQAAVLLLLPLAVLVVGAEWAGARPLETFAQALHQHRVILAHRTRWLWLALHPLEVAVGLGFPIVLAFARALDWRMLVAGARARALAGGELLLAAVLATLLLLDLSGQTKGEAARLWMGWFPLALAGGCGALRSRERGWAWLSAGLAGTLVVMKGFYVFVWLYRLG